MLESERWERLRQLTDGEPAPHYAVTLTWWQGSRQDFDRSPNVIQLLTTEATPYWVAEFTVDGRPLFAEFDRPPAGEHATRRLIGWPEIGGVVAIDGDGQRVVAVQPVHWKRPRGLTACE
ncbi:MAG: hypothetical protein ABMA25_04135 [Ilumatobacteraceae bacterium]